MRFQRSTALMPSHSMEDFPVHHDGEAANGLLANWTALWHPKLLAQTKATPAWCRAETAPEIEEGHLVLVPSVAAGELPASYQELIDRENSPVLVGLSDREKIVDSIFGETETASWSAELVEITRDFFSLGYAFLQTQLMTRQLRGTSCLDDLAFEKHLVEAAEKAVDSEFESANQALTACFDLLAEEKNNYYPVQTELVDLVLTAPTLLGKSLARQLKLEHTQNWLITGDSLLNIQRERDWWPELQKAIQDKQIQVVGGLQNELTFPLMAPEAVSNQLRHCEKTLESLELESSAVFAQRVPGLSPLVPTILEQLNFVGAMHMRFEPVDFPYASSGNIRWEGEAGASIVALSEPVLDATSGHSFLRLGIKIGEQIDSAHLSTLVLAHWPGRVHFCMEDLRRTCKFGRLFGRFVGLEDYFEQVYDPGYGESFTAEEYSFNEFGRQSKAGQRDPVSRWVRYRQRIAKLSLLRAVWAHWVGQMDEADDEVQSFGTRADSLQTEMEKATADGDGGGRLDEELAEFEKRLMETLLRDLNLTPDIGGNHLFVANANAGERATVVSFPQSEGQSLAGGSCLLSDSNDSQIQCLLALPQFTSSTLALESWKPGSASQPDLVIENRLHNEIFEVEIDPDRGGIQSVNLYERRKNILSQRLALRVPAVRDKSGIQVSSAQYAEMICDKLEVTQNTKIVGEITTTGRLVHDEQVVADFRQVVRIARGSRVIDVRVFLDPQTELTSGTGNYFCSRLAWKNEGEELVRGTQGMRAFAPGQWIQSSSFIEVVDPSRQITLLTGGIPFHRRSSSRTLDTILIPERESAREFRFGIGINLPFGEVAANEFMTPALAFRVGSASDSPTRTLGPLQFNGQHILPTWWEPVIDNHSKVIGMRIRFREVQGRAGQLVINSQLPIRSASKTNFRNEFLNDLESRETRAVLNFQSFDYVQIQLNWIK